LHATTMHGGASRPQEQSQQKKLQPYPAPAELDATSPGWAVGVVRELIKDLHAAAGTLPPKWFDPSGHQGVGPRDGGLDV
jgi:hypothetical protein